jgi:arylsulfatase A-like enzyme
MQSAGYATAICGKWHLGDRADTTDIPHHHGFDYAYCIGYPYPDRGWEHWPSHVFVNGRQTAIPVLGVASTRGRMTWQLAARVRLEA